MPLFLLTESSLLKTLTYTFVLFHCISTDLFLLKIQLFLIANTTVFVSKYNCICIQILKSMKSRTFRIFIFLELKEDYFTY